MRMTKLDYSKLEADVNAHRDWIIELVRSDHGGPGLGDEEAEKARAEFEANPWLALQAYVEYAAPEDPEVIARREAYFAELEEQAEPDASPLPASIACLTETIPA
jgi:hypothetical protein